MMTLEKFANIYFKTDLPHSMTPEEEESFQQSKVCWMCETSFAEGMNPLGETEGEF